MVVTHVEDENTKSSTVQNGHGMCLIGHGALYDLHVISTLAFLIPFDFVQISSSMKTPCSATNCFHGLCVRAVETI